MGEKRRVSVTIHDWMELDVDRVEEWVEANGPPDGQVKIQDVKTGEVLYSDLD